MSAPAAHPAQVAVVADLAPAEIAARSGSNFLIGFACLGRERRAGMTAIYAFCRVADDAVDDAPDAAEARAALQFWRDELDRAAAGATAADRSDGERPRTGVGRALRDTFARFGGGPAPLHALLDGMAMDLDAATFADLPRLLVYCDRVASAVGLACLPVLGADGDLAEDYAVQLGRALQLTNVLRDLAADARVGRRYVPADRLAAHGVDPTWLDGSGPAHVYAPGGPVERLCRDLADAAAAHFAGATALLRRMPRRTRRRLMPARIMGAVYGDLLRRLRRRGGAIGGARVRVPKPRKLWLLCRTICGALG